MQCLPVPQFNYAQASSSGRTCMQCCIKSQETYQFTEINGALRSFMMSLITTRFLASSTRLRVCCGPFCISPGPYLYSKGDYTCWQHCRFMMYHSHNLGKQCHLLYQHKWENTVIIYAILLETSSQDSLHGIIEQGEVKRWNLVPHLVTVNKVWCVLSATILFLYLFIFVSLQQGGTALCRLLRVKNNKSINLRGKHDKQHSENMLSMETR